MKSVFYTVIADYTSAYPDPLDLRSGDRVTVGREYDEDPEWAGWIWCETASGVAGWVPKAVLDISEARGVLREDFNTRELTVKTGERLRVTRILNGWAWGEKESGETGWVPLRHIETISGDDAENGFSGLAIRPFQETDRQAVIDLWRACGLVVDWNDPNRDIDRKLAADPAGFLVGILEDRLVATCMAGYEGHRGWINYLAVSPDRRRGGLGRRIMMAAEARLREIGCPKINLQVRQTNTDTIRFYESIGYTVDPVVSLGKRLEKDGPESLQDE